MDNGVVRCPAAEPLQGIRINVKRDDGSVVDMSTGVCDPHQRRVTVVSYRTRLNICGRENVRSGPRLDVVNRRKVDFPALEHEQRASILIPLQRGVAYAIAGSGVGQFG